MRLTDEQLKKVMPHAPKGKRTAALPVLQQVMTDYDITNEKRVSAFLATVAIESGELKYQEELASGSAYEGRKDLGNTQRGDGRRFKGRGRIQITGRANYQAYTNYLKRNKHLPFIDFVLHPERLADEPYATDAAGWFFAVYKKLNPIADKGDFYTTQIRVNGMNKKTRLPNHWNERQTYYARALSVLPDNFSLTLDEVPPEAKPHSSPLANPVNPSSIGVLPPQAGDDGDSIPDPSSQQTPPSAATETTATATVETDKGTIQQEVVQKNEQSVHEEAEVVEPKSQGFLAKFFAGIGTLLGGTLIYDAAGKLSGIQFTMQTVYIICFVLFLAFLGFCVWAILDTWKKNKKTELEVLANTAIDRKNIKWVKSE